MTGGADPERTLLAQLVADRLPELLSGRGAMGATPADLQRVKDQLDGLVREFDRFSTSVGHRLEAVEALDAEIESLRGVVRDAVAEAEQARRALAETSAEARTAIHEANAAQLAVALAAHDAKLAAIEGKVAPVAEGVEGWKWARRYWKLLVAVVSGVAGAALMGQKLVEAFLEK